MGGQVGVVAVIDGDEGRVSLCGGYRGHPRGEGSPDCDEVLLSTVGPYVNARREACVVIGVSDTVGDPGVEVGVPLFIGEGGTVSLVEVRDGGNGEVFLPCCNADLTEGDGEAPVVEEGLCLTIGRGRGYRLCDAEVFKLTDAKAKVSELAGQFKG